MGGLLATKDPTFDEHGQRKPHRNSAPRRQVAAPSGSLAADLARGEKDIIFFAERFLGVRLHAGQKRFAAAAAMALEDGYSPAFLDIALASGNRAGKTLVLAIVVFHHTFYKFGLRRPDPKDRDDVARWARAPYHWYHISYEGKVANLVHRELALIFSASHPAQQSRGCPLIEEFGPIVEYDRKELGEYQWVKVHPAFGGGEIHFRHTNEKAKALLGIDMNGISFDEAAFELYLIEIRSEVLHFRRLSTGGPIYWISTGTEGYNAFADLWEEGNPENPHRHTRSLSLRMSTRDNVGYGINQQMFDDLVATYDERLIPQNIDGFFIEAVDAYFYADTVNAAFVADLEGEAKPVKAHRYAQGSDLGMTNDATTSVVLDITVKPWVGVRIRQRSGRQSLPAVVNMIDEGRLLYQNAEAFCTTIVDSTGIGKVFVEEFRHIKPLRQFDFAGTKAKKLNLLSDLKGVIDRGDLVLPRGGLWGHLRRQLLGYKVKDDKLVTDLLMALALAVHHALRNPSNPVSNPTFDYFGGSD